MDKIQEILSVDPQWTKEEVTSALQQTNFNPAMAVLNLMQKGFVL